MRITIDIDEEELAEAVKNVLVRRTVEQVERDLYGEEPSYRRRAYTEEIKSAIRAVIRENKDDLMNRAVSAASYTIAHKALKGKTT